MSNNKQQVNNNRTTTLERTAAQATRGLKCILLAPNLHTRFCHCWSIRNAKPSWKPSNYCNVSSLWNTPIKLTHYNETKKGSHKNSKWVWSGNTTITNRRQPCGSARKSHSTIMRHQEDKLSKATSSLFPIKMIAILDISVNQITIKIILTWMPYGRWFMLSVETKGWRNMLV